MFNLVLYELKKIAGWKTAAALLVIGMVMSGLHLAISEKFSIEELEAETAAQSNSEEETIPVDERYNTLVAEQAVIEEYRADHKIKEPAEIWSFINNNMFVLNVLSILGIFWGASLFSKEFKTNTIKALLTTPYSRGQIYLSKLLTVGAVIFIGTMAMYLLSWLTGSIIHPSSIADSGSFLIIRDGEVTEYPAAAYTLLKYLLKGLEILAAACLALFLSVLLRGFLLSIILSYSLFFIGDAFVLYFSGKTEWVKYTLFATINFSSYMSGSSFMNGMDLSSSISITAAYMAVLFAISFVHLNRKDIGSS